MKRIWTPHHSYKIPNGWGFNFGGTLAKGVFFVVVESGEEFRSVRFATPEVEAWFQGNDYFSIEDKKTRTSVAFPEKWFARFRRNCWLSGYPIEASAHEKMEWMQGFTREEVEAWNLKF